MKNAKHLYVLHTSLKCVHRYTHLKNRLILPIKQYTDNPGLMEVPVKYACDLSDLSYVCHMVSLYGVHMVIGQTPK